MTDELNKVREAKKVLELKLRKDVGVGISKDEEGHHLVINLEKDDGEKWPTDINGVPVKIHVIGKIKAQI